MNINIKHAQATVQCIVYLGQLISLSPFYEALECQIAMIDSRRDHWTTSMKSKHFNL